MYTSLLSMLVAVAAASPAYPVLAERQFANSSTISLSPSTTSTLSLNATSTASACIGGITLVAGAGPTVTPDTVSAFLANAQLSSVAAANAAAPSGYSSVFTNIQASNNAPGYLGFNYINSYNPATCAGVCSNTSTCTSFNIYFERDPTVEPSSGSDCTNPSSTTSIKCAFWSSAISTNTSLNYGQWRQDFHAVISGSSGYVKTVNDPLASLGGYGQPTALVGAAIIDPYRCNNTSTYLGAQIFTSTNATLLDAARCASICSATLNCHFFNTYLWSKNNVTLNQHCAMYTLPWAAAYATNKGQWDAQGNHYTVSSSYTYTNTTNNGGTCVRT